MQIIGIEGMTASDLNDELQRGGRFVLFHYCVSVVVMTFRRSSDIYFIRAGESTAGTSIKYTAISILMGWWGLPWGPIHTVSSLFTNFGGGKDVTGEVIALLNSPSNQAGAEML
ncbi:MAG: hypothetical protein JST22_19465 [Bacteroidetes bacterium]|nr:hypothetical protein [Bacteroidota bacterium]